MELVTHVDVRDVGPDTEAADDAPLDHGVRIPLHDRPILVGAGLALVGVDHEIGGLGGVGLHEAPLDPHREASPAATADVRLLRLRDDIGLSHPERLARRTVALPSGSRAEDLGLRALVGVECPPLFYGVDLGQVVGAGEHA